MTVAIATSPASDENAAIILAILLAIAGGAALYFWLQAEYWKSRYQATKTLYDAHQRTYRRAQTPIHQTVVVESRDQRRLRKLRNLSRSSDNPNERMVADAIAQHIKQKTRYEDKVRSA